MNKKKYDLEIAMYPIDYEQCIVSENKICLQFETTEIKVRAPHEKRKLLTNVFNLGDILPIRTIPDDVEGINIGMILPVMKNAQRGLLNAYKEHLKKYPGVLTEFIKEIKEEIEKIEADTNRL